MTEQPMVSVVIPMYNAAAFIEQTLDSVLSQTYETFELLVVDDGSSDGSASIVASLAVNSNKLQLIQQENKGVSAARNTGIAAAKGEFVAFLDADDLWLPDNLNSKIDFLLANPNFLLVHAYEEIFDSTTGKMTAVARGAEGDTLEALLTLSHCVIHSPSSVVVRREALDLAGMFDPELSTSADWDMWVRLAKLAPFGLIQETLTRYRIHDGQMHLNITRMERDMVYAMTKAAEAGFFDGEAQRKYCFANLYLILAACYLGDARKPIKAIQMLARSALTDTRPVRQRLRRS